MTAPLVGLVLAAGWGRRLRPHTDELPKALVEVDEAGTTILDIALGNLAAAGLRDVVVVVGYRADQVERRQAALEERHGVTLHLVHNDKAEVWNNAYSLWCARERFGDGFLLVNGDTVHPAAVEEVLLSQGAADGITLALDRHKVLGEEEMKVVLDDAGSLRRITKLMDPGTAHGEYIGLTLVRGRETGVRLAAALQATFERDPDLYYEDGYQHLADAGEHIGGVAIPPGTAWVEVDDHVDLARARDIACRS